MSTTADEVNQNTKARREKAAKGNPANVDLEAQRKRDEALDEWINSAADQLLALDQQVKAINQEKQAIIEEAEVRGLARKTFKKKVKEKGMDESKRLAEEATARRMDRAFGWKYEQADMFEFGDKNEGLDLKEGQADAIMDHIAKHGTQPIGDTLDQQEAAGKAKKH